MLRSWIPGVREKAPKPQAPCLANPELSTTLDTRRPHDSLSTLASVSVLHDQSNERKHIPTCVPKSDRNIPARKECESSSSHGHAGSPLVAVDLSPNAAKKDEPADFCTGNFVFSSAIAGFLLGAHKFAVQARTARSQALLLTKRGDDALRENDADPRSAPLGPRRLGVWPRCAHAEPQAHSTLAITNAQ